MGTLYPLYNFISPVTGRILCDFNHILIGNSLGIAVPSTTVPISILPDLQYQYIWIGNSSNRPVAQAMITYDNFPDLQYQYILIGDSSNRPVAQAMITYDNFPDLPYNKIIIGNPNNRPTIGDLPQPQKGDKGDQGNNNQNSSTGDFGKLASAIIGGVIAAAVSNGPGTIKGQNGQVGAAGESGFNTVLWNTNFNMGGARVENIAQSPVADFDAISLRFLWDLLNDNVLIEWENW